jgi:glutathione S-transferase
MAWAMTDELVFYTNPMSRGRIVRWMLEEVGQPYRTEVLDYGTTMKAPEYRAINPMGKVPAIRHGDVVVTEAAAICAYLADAFPQAGLAPAPTDRLRGTYYRWLFFAAGRSRPRPPTSARRGAARPSARHGRLRLARGGDGRARARGEGPRVHRRRPLLGGRCLRRLAHRLGHAVRHVRAPPGVRALRRAGSWPARRPCARARSTTRCCRRARRHGQKPAS